MLISAMQHPIVLAYCNYIVKVMGSKVTLLVRSLKGTKWYYGGIPLKGHGGFKVGAPPKIWVDLRCSTSVGSHCFEFVVAPVIHMSRIWINIGITKFSKSRKACLLFRSFYL